MSAFFSFFFFLLTPTARFFSPKSNLLSNHKTRHTKKSCIVVLLTASIVPLQKSTLENLCMQFNQSFTLKCVSLLLFHGPFYKATVVPVWLWGSENSGLYPTRGKKQKNLGTNDAMQLKVGGHGTRAPPVWRPMHCFKDRTTQLYWTSSSAGRIRCFT